MSVARSGLLKNTLQYLRMASTALLSLGFDVLTAALVASTYWTIFTHVSRHAQEYSTLTEAIMEVVCKVWLQVQSVQAHYKGMFITHSAVGSVIRVVCAVRQGRRPCEA